MYKKFANFTFLCIEFNGSFRFSTCFLLYMPGWEAKVWRGSQDQQRLPVYYFFVVAQTLHTYFFLDCLIFDKAVRIKGKRNDDVKFVLSKGL